MHGPDVVGEVPVALLAVAGELAVVLVGDGRHQRDAHHGLAVVLLPLVGCDNAFQVAAEVAQPCFAGVGLAHAEANDDDVGLVSEKG